MSTFSERVAALTDEVRGITARAPKLPEATGTAAAVSKASGITNRAKSAVQALQALSKIKAVDSPDLKRHRGKALMDLRGIVNDVAATVKVLGLKDVAAALAREAKGLK